VEQTQIFQLQKKEPPTYTGDVLCTYADVDDLIEDVGFSHQMIKVFITLFSGIKILQLSKLVITARAIPPRINPAVAIVVALVANFFHGWCLDWSR